MMVSFMLVCTLFLAVSLVSGVFETLDTPPNPRVVGQLTVSNGLRFGNWGEAKFCPDGQFIYHLATLKIDAYQGRNSDDSSINGMKLTCNQYGQNKYRYVSPDAGPFGRWHGLTKAKCYYSGNVWDHKWDYFTSFALKVLAEQPSLGDDSAVNNIKFKCRDVAGTKSSYGVPIPATDKWYVTFPLKEFGTFGDWSGDCPAGSAICGVKTKVEGAQGGAVWQDDTALNDVIFYCCN